MLAENSEFLKYDKPMLLHDWHSDNENENVFISFNGINPNEDFLFEMKDTKEALRLIKFLTERTPISFYRPIGFPRNK